MTNPGIKVVWGVPLVQMPTVYADGAPSGRKRFVFRSGSAARVYIKTEDGIAGFYLKDQGAYWEVDPNLCIGRNQRK